MNDFKVDHGSWHFRLNRSMVAGRKHISDEVAAQQIMAERKDFCSYWRLTASSVLRAITIAFFLCMMVVGFLILVSAPFRYDWNFSWVGLIDFLKAIGGFVIMAVVFAICIGVFGYIKNKIVETFSYGRAKRSDKVKSDGLFVTKMKSVKGRYCPMVTYNGR
jgi:hypothetical protein